MSELPWNELVTTFQVHPESACYQDIMRLAEEWAGLTERVKVLEEALANILLYPDMNAHVGDLVYKRAQTALRGEEQGK